MKVVRNFEQMNDPADADMYPSFCTAWICPGDVARLQLGEALFRFDSSGCLRPCSFLVCREGPCDAQRDVPRVHGFPRLPQPPQC